MSYRLAPPSPRRVSNLHQIFPQLSLSHLFSSHFIPSLAHLHHSINANATITDTYTQTHHVLPQANHPTPAGNDAPLPPTPGIEGIRTDDITAASHSHDSEAMHSATMLCAANYYQDEQGRGGTEASGQGSGLAS